MRIKGAVVMVALMVWLAAQPAAAQLWVTHGEASDYQGEPAVRFQVYHIHGMFWCVGYLYLTKNRIGYQVTGGPGDYSQDSFARNRSEVQFQTAGQSITVRILRGRRYDLIVVRDIDAYGNVNTEAVSTWPIQDAWDSFDQALERARTRWDPNKPPEPPPAPEAPKTAALAIEAKPGGAEFYVDDEFRGSTSSEGRIKVSELEPGEHSLRLSLKGYQEWTRKVTLEAGENRTIEVQLAEAKPEPPPAPPEPSPEEKKRLGLEEVVKLLESGVTPVRAEAIVKERGVSFTLDDAAEKKLREAGATDALLLAIAKAKK